MSSSLGAALSPLLRDAMIFSGPRGIEQAAAPYRPRPKSIPDGIDGFVQGTLSLPLAIVEEVALDRPVTRQTRRTHAQQP